MRLVLAIRLEQGVEIIWEKFDSFWPISFMFFFHAKKSLPYVSVNALFSEFVGRTRTYNLITRHTFLMIFHCWFYEQSKWSPQLLVIHWLGHVPFSWFLVIQLASRPGRITGLPRWQLKGTCPGTPRWTVNTSYHQTSGTAYSVSMVLLLPPAAGSERFGFLPRPSQNCDYKHGIRKISTYNVSILISLPFSPSIDL